MSVPINPPVDMIFVEAIEEARVRSTCPRVSGMATAPNPKIGWPQARIWSPCTTVVTVQPGAIERSPRMSSMPTMSPGLRLASSGDGSGGAAGHHRHAPGGKLLAELRDCFGIQAGGNQRRFNRNEKLAARRRWSGEHSFRAAECARRRSRLGLRASRRASGWREWPRLFPRRACFRSE